MTRTKIYKNLAQQGHYCIFRGDSAVEIVQSPSQTYVITIRDAAQLQKDLNVAPQLKRLYDFQESSFLDILVVTGVTKGRIHEIMEE